MQQKTINNLILNLFTTSNNNKVKHYFIIKKHSKQTKHIKVIKNSLTSTYKNLYKCYNCTLQQLNFIQFAYSTNNVKYNLSFKYNCVNNYKQLKSILQTM